MWKLMDGASKVDSIDNVVEDMNSYDLSMSIVQEDAHIQTKKKKRQDAQLSQRDRAAGCVIVFAKSRRLELGDNILRTI